MERTRFRFGLLFLLLIILASEGMVMQSEARHCESKSHSFRGICLSDHNCASVCRSEGYTGGDCGGFRRRCFCSRFC